MPSLPISLPFRLSNQHFVCISQLPIHAACPAHLILLDLITLTIVCENAHYGAPHYAVFFTSLWKQQ
jgi:hypothetical protein